MAIVKTKDKTGTKDIYKYKELEWEVLYERVAELLDCFGDYVGVHEDLSLEDVRVDQPLLAEIMERIDKRKDYFVIFHDDTDMNEIKQAALTAYWVLKFKPFSVDSDDTKLCTKYELINEAFAVFVLYSTIKEEAYRKKCEGFYVSKEYNRKIMYGFKFWDISKEALMLVAESLCEAMYGRRKVNV